MNAEYRFTMTPENVLKYASFMQSIGAMKKAPASWKELFFPNVHSLPGSGRDRQRRGRINSALQNPMFFLRVHSHTVLRFCIAAD